MSNWIAIQPSDLPDAKVAALVTAFQTAALGVDQADPTAVVIQDVTNRIRSEIKGCQRNYLDIDQTKIPADLKSLGVRMVLRQLSSRVQVPLTEDEREEQRNDLRYLARIAACEIPIDLPDNPTPDGELQSVVGTPRIERRRRAFTGHAEDGA